MEGLRLFPSVNTVPKGVLRPGPITLHTVPKKASDEPQPVPVHLTKGTYIRFDVTALCYRGKSPLPPPCPCRTLEADESRWRRSRALGRGRRRVQAVALHRHGRVQVAARRVPALRRRGAGVHRQAVGHHGGHRLPRPHRHQVQDRGPGRPRGRVGAPARGERE
jgi:hypothetical protein